MTIARRFPLLLAVLGLNACTWIELTAAGAGVAQGTPGAVYGCELVGNVAASTQDRVLLKRGRGKVAEELIVMARNEAATLGGDTVVPAGPMVDGRQDFKVYRCGPGPTGDV
ncbi:MAG: DUF4156 domain-containing protein [Pseudomonadales bacterium]